MVESPRSRGREWLRRGLLVLGSVAVFLAGGELICRALFGAELDSTGWGPAYRKWFATVRHDPLGLRCGAADCAAPTPDPAAWTILVLGDSVTYGSGVGYDAVFTSRMQELLDRREDGVRYRVVNVSAPGLDTAAEAQILTRIAPHVNPDVILLIYYPNDVVAEGDPRLAIFDRRLLGERLGGWLYQHSSFYYFLDTRWTRLQQRLGWRLSPEEFLEQAYAGSDPHLESHLESLVGVIENVRLNGKPLGIVIFPMLFRLEDYPFSRAGELVSTVADGLDVPTLDLLPHYQARGTEDLILSAYDNRPNARGHAVAAEAVVPWLEEAGLLAPGPAVVNPEQLE